MDAGVGVEQLGRNFVLALTGPLEGRQMKDARRLWRVCQKLENALAFAKIADIAPERMERQATTPEISLQVAAKKAGGADDQVKSAFGRHRGTSLW